MKINAKIWLLSLIVMVTTSCSGFLDKAPLEDLTTDNFWTCESDAELWTVGMYDLMQKAFNDNYFLWGEVRSDNCQQAGSGSSQSTYLYNGLYSTLSSANWAALYKVISQTNFAIKYFPTIPESKSVINPYLGQAYAARAMMYFYAIRVWGGVPLITEPYEGKPEQQKYYPRSSVADIEELILSDIEDAKDCLTSSASDPTMLNIGAVLALEADYYMWIAGELRAAEGDDSVAAKAAYEKVLTSTDAITNLGYTYASTEAAWKNIFDNPRESKEPIFFLDWDAATEGVNGLSKFLAREGSNPQYKCSQGLWDKMVDDRIKDDGSSDDYRLYYMTDSYKLNTTLNGAAVTKEVYESATFNKNFYFSKYSIEDPNMVDKDGKVIGGFISPSTVTTMPMFPVYRYSGMMLMRAEALNRLGRLDDAKVIVDYVRSRAGYVGYTYTATDDEVANFEAIILHERQIELFGEGSRWFDLVRTNTVPSTMDPILASKGVNDNYTDNPGRILFPIHTSAFEANPLLTQNAPYTK